MNDAPRRRGRPTEGQLVSVRLEPHVVRRLDRLARARGLTRAGLLRDIVSHADLDLGVDRTQIRRMLRMTPAERVEHMADVANKLRPWRGVAASR